MTRLVPEKSIFLATALENVRNQFRHAEFAMMFHDKNELSALALADLLFDACQNNRGFFAGRESEFPFNPELIDRQINQPPTKDGVYLEATPDYQALLDYAGRRFGVTAVRIDELIAERVRIQLGG